MHVLKRIVVVMGLLVVTGVLNAEPASQKADVILPAELVTRLVVSEGLRELTSLWRDRIHWSFMFLNYEVANTEYWKSIKSAEGRQSFVVVWSYPAGFDESGITQSRIDSIGKHLLIETEASLEYYALADRYIVSVLYVGGKLR